MTEVIMWVEKNPDGTFENMSDGTPFLWLNKPSFTDKEIVRVIIKEFPEEAEKSDLPAIEPAPISVNCNACNEGTPFPCHTAEVARNLKCWRFESGRAEG